MLTEHSVFNDKKCYAVIHNLTNAAPVVEIRPDENVAPLCWQDISGITLQCPLKCRASGRC